jgi:signal transduction histidine kinase
VDRVLGLIRSASLPDRAAAAVGVLAFALGLAALTTSRVDLGVTLVDDGTFVRIGDVAPYSPARLDGFDSGMVVVSLNGFDLIRLPGREYYEIDELGNEVGPGPVTVTEPTPVAIDPAVRSELVVLEPVYYLEAITEAELQGEFYRTAWLGPPFFNDLVGAGPWLLLGSLIALAGGWFLAGGRAGESLRPLAVPLAVATATPFLVRPIEATWDALPVLAAGVLLPVAMVPLALGLADRIADETVRRAARTTSLGAAVAAASIGLVRPVSDAGTGLDLWVWPALVAAIPLIPGVAAAVPTRPRTPAATSSRGLVASAELGAAGITPLMAIATAPYAPYAIPFSLWLLVLVVAARSTIRPLARLATRAQLQRDLVVAATEAERARVAADIHDDALQELTILVRRLETAGDVEGADIARTVSDRLRAICGDLRLPILDDLGVGPALDWLVLRIERLAGGEVRLERADGTRPPPEVELAIFRVAQEALGNAVKHGKPPIVVRYHATEAGASLSVDDAGPGIEPDAPTRAEQEGRFGLLNMQQRAEGIGAILDVRRWPGGGTHVALEWRPH